MPELAEVEYFRRRWDPGLGRRVRAVHVHAGRRIYRDVDAAALTRALTGKALLESWAHGKQMLFHFSGGHWLGVHLGMTGELRCERGAPAPSRHDHLVLRVDRQSLVFSDPRQFGRLFWAEGQRPPTWWTERPPSVVSPEFKVAAVAAFLDRRSRSPIKAVLLMQEQFPGIGNWMADEILWRAGIHPSRKAGRVTVDARRIWSETRWVANGALRIVAPNFSDPPASWLFRHRWKAGGRCPRDGTPLRRATVGGRTTVWCERCQPRT